MCWSALQQLTAVGSGDHGRGHGRLHEHPWCASPVRRDGPEIGSEVTGQRVQERAALQPQGLVVDASALRNRSVPARAQVQDVQPPKGGGRGAGDALLEGDAGAVRGQGGALDVAVQGPQRAPGQVAFDEMGTAAGGEGRVEAVVVGGEGDAPEVVVGGLVAASVLEDGELLEAGPQDAGAGVVDGGTGGEGAARVRVSAKANQGLCFCAYCPLVQAVDPSLGRSSL
jgi:hypothetical protein